MGAVASSGISVKAVDSASASVVVAASTETESQRQLVRPGSRLEQMIESSGLIELRAISARGRHRAIGERNSLVDLRGRAGIFKPNRPWLARRMRPERVNLAHIDHGVLDSAGAQKVNDPVGDVSFPDAIQRDAHPRSRQTDTVGVHHHSILSDARDGGGDRLGGRTFGRSVRPRKMRRIEIPKRLHRHVEGARRQVAIAAAFGKHPDQIERRIFDKSIPIETRQRAVRTIQAHHLLQPLDFGQARRDQPIGGGRVGVVNLHRGVGAQRRARPDAKQGICCGRCACGREGKQRQSASSGRDGDEAPARGLHHCSPEFEARM